MCGIFGIWEHPDAAALTSLGIHALQHRGQAAAGIASFDDAFHLERHASLVGDNFTKPEVIARLSGRRAVGHVRYPTHGSAALERNIQPLFAELSGGGFVVVHNGNLTNAALLRNKLQKEGSIFQSDSDTEVILHLTALSQQEKLVDRLVDALGQVEGAYALVCLSTKKMIGCRDPLGVRPLLLGDLDGSPIITAETCALDIVGAKFVRDIAPGEMVVVTEAGVESIFPFPKVRSRFCIFEYVYFARPDSVVEGRGVYEIRKRIGRELAMRHPAIADVVVPVPDSGVPAAIGYAEAAKLPYELGIIRNHYVGRTFIEPEQSIRDMGVKLKHNVNRSVVAGKRVVLVDDSIVRGTTSLKIVKMLREAGASEVHFRVASPAISNSCFYGVDTPEQEKLMAAQMPEHKMAERIGVDSLGFVSLDGLYRAVGEPWRGSGRKVQFCDACFTGEYPTPLTDRSLLSKELPA